MRWTMKQAGIKRTGSLMMIGMLLSLTVLACAPAAAPSAAPQESAPTTGGEVKDFVTWYQYDQTNEDTKSDERVGNEYLRKTLPLFNEAYKGKWNWINQPKAFDKMTTELIAAVQAAGDVPDLMHVGSSDILTFYQNGTLQDLGEWAALVLKRQ